MTPEERFQRLSTQLIKSRGVILASGAAGSRKSFGSRGQLKVNDKVFAFVSRGRLVVKLPRARVDALVAAGEADRFDPGHGRLMKEWLALKPKSELGWLPLAREALEFVAGMLVRRV